ncbi:MAG TPA: 50S ribosomal protein L6, partial [Ignavibacteriaceae bacterium]|nr:50S ribosomal protein L6 [Ignavibacteriaceae bacterium]
MGYSHPIYFIPPTGIKLETTTPTHIVITGIDKQLVGQVAAKIRSIRKPEPYKGKGIKYSNEQILRKAGKTA